MNSSQRAELLISLLRAFDAIDSFEEKCIIFESFGLPAPNWSLNGDREEPGILKRASDSILRDLQLHFGLQEFGDPMNMSFPECWKQSDCRVFISHLSSQKKIAKALKDQLAKFGFSGFVAHEDINPSDEWVREIRSALQTCDLLIAVIDDGFRESEWCDQELGAAIGRMVPVVSLFKKTKLHGFAQYVQGMPVLDKNVNDVIPGIVKLALGHHMTACAATTALSRSILSSINKKDCRELAGYIDHIERLDSISAMLLQEALNSNKIVQEDAYVNFAVKGVLNAFSYPIETRKTDAISISHDDIPF